MAPGVAPRGPRLRPARGERSAARAASCLGAVAVACAALTAAPRAPAGEESPRDAAAPRARVLDPRRFEHHIDAFNAADEEPVVQDQRVMSRRDHFEALRIYTRSHRRALPDGRTIEWIDENLDPFTGEWLARRLKIEKGRFDGRGDHYNHSAYCDLIVTGLVGLRPRPDDIVVVHPLLPEGEWSWLCLDAIHYHGRALTILWDATGERYGRGKGLRVLADGAEIARSDTLSAVRGRLPAPRRESAQPASGPGGR